MFLELKMFPSCMNFVVRFQLVQHLPGLSCWVCADFKWCILTLWLKSIQLWEESLSLNCRSLGEILSPYIFFFFFPVRCNGASRLRWHCLGPDLRAGVVMAAGVHAVCLCMMPTYTHNGKCVLEIFLTAGL